MDTSAKNPIARFWYSMLNSMAEVTGQIFLLVHLTDGDMVAGTGGNEEQDLSGRRIYDSGLFPS